MSIQIDNKNHKNKHICHVFIIYLLCYFLLLLLYHQHKLIFRLSKKL